MQIKYKYNKTLLGDDWKVYRYKRRQLGAYLNDKYYLVANAPRLVNIEQGLCISRYADSGGSIDIELPNIIATDIKELYKFIDLAENDLYERNK